MATQIGSKRGRPPTRIVRVAKSYQMDPDLHEQLARYAKLNKYTMAEVAECAIREFLEKRCED